MSRRERTRRELLAALSGVAGSAGCVGRGPRVSRGGGTASGRTVTGPTGLRLENAQVVVGVDAPARQPLAGVTVLGPRDEPALVGPLQARPHSPVSRTESRPPSYVRTDRFAVLETGGDRARYRVRRRFHLVGRPIDIGWTVTLPRGWPFVVLRVDIRNRGGAPIELDQDAGDTHDGIQVLSDVQLRGRARTARDYRFHVPGAGTERFRDQPLWKTFPAPRRVTLFDGRAGVTVGWLGGASGLKMIVTEETRLDLLANELRLGAGDRASYRFVLAVHRGGSRAPAYGRGFVRRGRAWHGEQPDH